MKKKKTHFTLDWDEKRRRGGKKERNNIPAAHFLSLTLSVTAGSHCTHSESQPAERCVICLDLSGPGRAGPGWGGAEPGGEGQDDRDQSFRQAQGERNGRQSR